MRSNKGKDCTGYALTSKMKELIFNHKEELETFRKHHEEVLSRANDTIIKINDENADLERLLRSIRDDLMEMINANYISLATISKYTSIKRILLDKRILGDK